MSRYLEDYPLHKAAASGDVNRIRELLGGGMKVDSRNRSNETPLMAAVKTARVDVVQVFIEAKANLNAKDRASAVGEGKQTALHRAVRFGYKRIVTALLKAGADVDPTSQSGFTPLGLACSNANINLVRLLMDHGANPNGAGVRYGTPLTLVVTESTVAFSEKRQERQAAALEVILELLRRGADPNVQGGGELPLHGAMSPTIARELLATGANVNARNSKGETPLIIWAKAGPLDLLRLLVKAGADVNVESNEGETALKRVIQREPPEIEAMGLLVSAGGDIHAVDKWGLSLLDYYLWWYEMKERDRRGADPLGVALAGLKFHETERARCIQFLRDRGAKSEVQRRKAEKNMKARKLPNDTKGGMLSWL